jgi:hypothetical protein
VYNVSRGVCGCVRLANPAILDAERLRVYHDERPSSESDPTSPATKRLRRLGQLTPVGSWLVSAHRLFTDMMWSSGLFRLLSAAHDAELGSKGNVLESWVALGVSWMD